MHSLPICRAEDFPQSLFGHLPMWLRRLDLLLPRIRQAKYPLASVFSWPDMNPTLLVQQGQRTCKRRAIHGKPETQLFLVGPVDDSKRRQQAELGDFDSGLAKLLIINPRYHPGEAAQVLTRTRHVKKCVRGPNSKGSSPHIICIYILVRRLSKGDFRPLITLECFTGKDVLQKSSGPVIKENDFSLKRAFRLLSPYHISAGDTLRVITLADRSSSCILLREEY
jgi:hypothetical protein